ncbi:MAG: hypothetical protein V3T14_10480 [Myxococcota bacterium]
MRRTPATALGLVLLAACTSGASGSGAPMRIRTALEALEAAEFRFDADVRFRVDPYVVCEGIACADLVVLEHRRTILLAPDALRSDDVLKASLLEIWERYREPRPGSGRDLARGAYRVVQDGPRVGIVDRDLIRRARLRYTQLYELLSPAERAGLPEPAGVGAPL